MGRAAVAAVTNVAGITFLARGLQRRDHFAFAQLGFGTAVQVHDIELVRFQSRQTALNALQNRILRPIGGALHAVGMSAFGKEKVFVASMSDGLAGLLTAVARTLGRMVNI